MMIFLIILLASSWLEAFTRLHWLLEWKLQQFCCQPIHPLSTVMGGLGGGGGDTNCKQAASDDCGQSLPSALVVDN